MKEHSEIIINHTSTWWQHEGRAECLYCEYDHTETTFNIAGSTLLKDEAKELVEFILKMIGE